MQINNEQRLKTRPTRARRPPTRQTRFTKAKTLVSSWPVVITIMAVYYHDCNAAFRLPCFFERRETKHGKKKSIKKLLVACTRRSRSRNRLLAAAPFIVVLDERSGIDSRDNFSWRFLRRVVFFVYLRSKNILRRYVFIHARALVFNIWYWFSVHTNGKSTSRIVIKNFQYARFFFSSRTHTAAATIETCTIRKNERIFLDFFSFQTFPRDYLYIHFESVVL